MVNQIWIQGDEMENSKGNKNVPRSRRIKILVIQNEQKEEGS